jgi:transcriptional repressor NrdR
VVTSSLRGVHCAACGHDDTKVIDSRVTDDGAAIRRRRQCPACNRRVTTYERVEEVPLMVVKTHGGRQPFDRNKIVAGIVAASKGRPVDDATIDAVAEALEDELRLVGPEITTVQIGLAVLNRLRDLDDVAYLRFASVYKNFDAAEDFQRELTLLEKSPSVG